MVDQTARGEFPGERTDFERGDEGSVAVQRYDPWVAFYGFWHRFVGHPTVVFAGSATLGTLVLVRQFYAFVSGPSEWSGLPPVVVLGGGVLFGFGLGYYVIRDAATCPECGTAFSHERVAKYPIRSDSNRVFVEEILECRTCDHLTTEQYAQCETNDPRW